MTAEEIRNIEIDLDASQDWYIRLQTIFLQEIAAQLAEQNEHRASVKGFNKWRP